MRKLMLDVDALVVESFSVSAIEGNIIGHETGKISVCNHICDPTAAPDPDETMQTCNQTGCATCHTFCQQLSCGGDRVGCSVVWC